MKRLNILLGFGLFFFYVSGWCAIPKLINFQGILRNGSGNPVPDGSYSVTFRIYDAPSGGNVLWTEVQSIAPSGGFFNVLLGATNFVPDSAFNGANRYLGITVESDPEMSPRYQLVSIGYAFRVNSVDGALGGTISGNINVTGEATIGSGHTNTGNFAFVAGNRHTATGAGSTIGRGDTNTVTSDAATIGGGKANIASNYDCWGLFKYRKRR